MTNMNTGAASLSDAFETLIDIYQDAQNGGTTEQKAKARGALKAAFKSALMCSSGSRATPSPQADAAPSELASMTRMFHAACADLGAINEALGLDPDDGGAEPILDAIAELKKSRDKWVDAQYADDGKCRSCEGDNCVTGPQCVTLGRDAAIAAGGAQEPDNKVMVARMGYGSVAVGECLSEETGEPGIIYMALDTAREIDSDTTDVYPVGSRPGTDRVLAYVSFKTPAAVDQTIAILAELKAKYWPDAASLPREAATVELTADDADMVWPQDDGEVMHHSLDDAVEYEINQAWPVEAPLEFTFQIAKRIPDVTIRVTEITENGHEWEIVAAPAAASNGEQA